MKEVSSTRIVLIGLFWVQDTTKASVCVRLLCYRVLLCWWIKSNLLLFWWWWCRQVSSSCSVYIMIRFQEWADGVTIERLVAQSLKNETESREKKCNNWHHISCEIVWFECFLGSRMYSDIKSVISISFFKEFLNTRLLELISWFDPAIATSGLKFTIWNGRDFENILFEKALNRKIAFETRSCENLISQYNFKRIFD